MPNTDFGLSRISATPGPGSQQKRLEEKASHVSRSCGLADIEGCAAPNVDVSSER